jgi:hypothetical protein
VAAGSSPAARLPVTLRSLERRWRVVAYVALALLAVWYFAVRHASVAGVVIGCGLAVVLLAATWIVLRARLVVDSGGLTDYRALRAVRVRWEDVADFEVARPAGPWGGFCVRVTQRVGKPVDLLATRGYSLLPLGSGYDGYIG